MTTDILHGLLERELPAAQRGDRNAYARLVAATQRMVASVALAITHDVALSEDIAQETFLRAWQKLDLMRSPSSFLPWLRQIARNRALDHVRAQRYRETVADPMEPILAGVATAAPEPAEAVGAAQDAAWLAQALDEIPEESREVLLLFYREGQSSRAVAALLGMSDGAVCKRLQRARDTLREEWLRRAGEAAARSAPGAGFTSMVVAALAMRPELAAAGGGAGALLKASPKALLGPFGALFASIGLVVGAVWVEMRGYLKRAQRRRAPRPAPQRFRLRRADGDLHGAAVVGRARAVDAGADARRRRRLLDRDRRARAAPPRAAAPPARMSPSPRPAAPS
jgi:RNA polymerase sigma factor (sigma-70 family)